MGGKNKKQQTPVTQETTMVRPKSDAGGRDSRTMPKRGRSVRGGNGTSTAPNKKQRKNNDKNSDWIANLAKQSVSENISPVPSKEDRIRKREEKKAKRIVQKQQQEEDRHGLKKAPSSSARVTSTSSGVQRKHVVEISKRRLQRIADTVQTLRQLYIAQYKDETGDRKRPRQYEPAADSNKKRKVGRWTEDSIQPRPSDYSGIGLARKSLYLEFADPSCIAKLEEEFQEHIPGFFGKQRTKAMKRQMDGNMLWRQLANSKKNMSKKMKSMSPDERVQAMLDAGII